MKKRGGKLLAEASPREDTAPSPREDTAPVQEIGADQEIEVSPLYGTEGAEEQYPPTRNFGGRPRESTLANKKKRQDELDACYCAITNLYISKNKECSSRFPNNFLKETIDAQKEAFGISLENNLVTPQFESVREEAKTESIRDQFHLLQRLNPQLLPYVSKWNFSGNL